MYVRGEDHTEEGGGQDKALLGQGHRDRLEPLTCPVQIVLHTTQNSYRIVVVILNCIMSLKCLLHEIITLKSSKSRHLKKCKFYIAQRNQLFLRHIFSSSLKIILVPD